MEIQLTDFENAAFTVFFILLTRVITAFNLFLVIPLSKVDDNMERAHCRNAAKEQKFWFRAKVDKESHNEMSAVEMTMTEIMMGNGSLDSPGLLPLCFAYLEFIQCDPESFRQIRKYLNFIKERATGHLLTPATWMRHFVQAHPEYKQDSVVTQSIAYDLVQMCDRIGRGECKCPDLLGNVIIEPVKRDGHYPISIDRVSSRNRTQRLVDLLNKYVESATSSSDRSDQLPPTPQHRKGVFEEAE